jgi:hypothetical protein
MRAAAEQTSGVPEHGTSWAVERTEVFIFRDTRKADTWGHRRPQRPGGIEEQAL